MKIFRGLAAGLLILGVAPVLNAASPKAAEHGNKGHELAQALKYDEAIVEYTKAIAIDAKDVRLYVDRGLVYRAATKIPEAMADFTKAVELEPKNDAGVFRAGPNPVGPKSVRGRSGGPEQGHRAESE